MIAINHSEANRMDNLGALALKMQKTGQPTFVDVAEQDDRIESEKNTKASLLKIAGAFLRMAKPFSGMVFAEATLQASVADPRLIREFNDSTNLLINEDTTAYTMPNRRIAYVTPYRKVTDSETFPQVTNVVSKARRYFFKYIKGWEINDRDIAGNDLGDDATTYVATARSHMFPEKVDAVATARTINVTVAKGTIPNNSLSAEIIEHAITGMSDKLSIMISELGQDARVVSGSYGFKNWDKALNKADPRDRKVILNEIMSPRPVAEQIAEALFNPSSDTVAASILEILQTGGNLTIIERLTAGITPDLKLASDITLTIMTEAATKSLINGDYLWLIQTDSAFLHRLIETFGEDSISILARTVQKKHNPRNKEVADVCHTLGLDLRKAAKYLEDEPIEGYNGPNDKYWDDRKYLHEAFKRRMSILEEQKQAALQHQPEAA